MNENIGERLIFQAINRNITDHKEAQKITVSFR